MKGLGHKQWQHEVLEARGWRQRGALKPRNLQEQVGVIEEQCLKLVFATVFCYWDISYVICVGFEPLGMFL